MKKLVISLSLLNTLVACVAPQTPSNTIPSASSTPTVVPSSNSSIAPSPVPTLPPASSTPIPSATPITTPVPTPTATPIPTPTPTINPVVIKPVNLNFGITEPFKYVTDGLSDDIERDIRDISKDLITLNPSFVIVNLNQKVVDPTLDVKDLRWLMYDRIIEVLKGQNIEIMFLLKHEYLLTTTSSPTTTNYEEFLKKFFERYKDNKISFVIGEKINDPNSLPGTQRDYLNFLIRNYSYIKTVAPDKKVYAGSFVQAEPFGKDENFTAENLLSYLNMGMDKYCDGYVFENLFLSGRAFDNRDSKTFFSGTDYTLSNKYYSVISEIFKEKKVANKKLFLISGTYGGETLNEVSQTELQQANEMIKSFVYSASLGFDGAATPRFFDRKPEESASFEGKTGLIKNSSSTLEKKLAFFSFKFISEKLKDATYKGKIPNLTNNLEGFIFEKENKNYYVMFNTDPKFIENVPITVKGKSAIRYITPSESSTIGTSTNFTVPDNGLIYADFIIDNLNPRIIETVN